MRPMKLIAVNKLSCAATLAVTVSTLNLGIIYPAAAQSREAWKFTGISQEVFDCMKRNNGTPKKPVNEGWVVYEGKTNGTVKVNSKQIGEVANLSFQFNASNETLDLGIKKITVPPVTAVRSLVVNRLENGFKGTIAKCKNGSYR
jgi:hypothetical protein